jgi:hypothetical protein
MGELLQRDDPIRVLIALFHEVRPDLRGDFLRVAQQLL